MTRIKTLLLAGAIAGLGLGATVAPAMADPLSGTFSVSLWNYKSPGAHANSANQQALPSNPKANGTADYTGTYTGPIDFDLGKHATDTVGAFFGSASGSLSPSLGAVAKDTLSSSGFKHATLISFDFSLTNSISLSLEHDDGVSLFSGNTNLLPTGASAPTTEIPAGPVTLGPGNYTLWYVEANGVPAVLTTTSTPVPEPGSLALLGTALLGFGAIGWCWRKRQAA